VIELGVAFALNVEVDGKKELYNEVKDEYVRAPVYDHTMPGFLVRYLDIYLPQVDRVLIDEAHDANSNDCHAAYKMVKPGGCLLMMRDESQALNQWASADLDAQNRLMAGATEHQSPRNFRCALSICELAQTVLDEQGRDITIIPVRDVVGCVEYSSLYAAPFDLSTTNLVLSRLVAHLPIMYSVLLSKKIPCVIIGHENTGKRLLALLVGVSTERGRTSRVLLSRSRELLLVKVTTLAKNKCTSDTFDLYSALLATLEVFAASDGVNLDAPGAVDAFKAHIHNIYNPTVLDGESFVGIVRLSSIHRAKGLKARHVRIVQPDLVPLADRVAKGGWHAHEELCAKYVAYTRAEDRLIFLPMLPRFTRDTFLELFEPNADDDASEGSDAELPSSSQDTAVPEDVSNEVDLALRELRLQAMPESREALNKVVKTLLFQVHPDRNFGSAAAKDFTQRILHARSVLMSQL